MVPLSVVITKERIEPTVGGGTVPAAESQVPPEDTIDREANKGNKIEGHIIKQHG